jgi:uncharacterized protein (TIGR02466 family)
LDNTVIPLFAMPLFYTEVEPISEETKTYLKGLPFERLKIDNGWNSKCKCILDTPPCVELKHSILERVNHYAKEVIQINKDLEFYVTNSWVIKHERGDWGQQHIHTNSVFSGCVYIDCDQTSGDIVFHKPLGLNNCISSTIDMSCSNWNIFNSKAWSVKPRNNSLVLFPSQLPHSVNTNTSEIVRYSLAFNVFVRGKIGTDEDLCELIL